MTPHPRIPTPLILLALTCALSLVASACGKQACFFWTKAEGACPSQAEAIQFFGDQNCGSPIESIDSEPDYDGELCCYDVTERSTSDVPCATGAGGFGSGGVVGSAVAVSTGSGVCTSCSSSATAAFMGVQPKGLCQSSQQIWDALSTCVCSPACQPACADNLCMGLSASTPCFDCATDSAVGCGNQFSACVNDI